MTPPPRRRLAAIDDPLEASQEVRPIRQESRPSEQMPALFVRLPVEQSDALARAAFELRAHKREIVCALVARYVDPFSEDSMRSLRLLLDEQRRIAR